jgi:type III secretory pathway component EscU
MVFYKMIAIAITSILVLGLLIVYFINRRKRNNELKMHQDELRHKEYMEASKQHNEHVKRMLDIITDESADKVVKKEVVRLLKEQGKKGNLIEHKR